MKHNILSYLLLALWVVSGCSLLVEVKDPPETKFCGDGQISGDEECDGSNLANKTCAILSLGSGLLTCNADCKFNTAGCELASNCGNGSIEGSEQCDGANLGGKTCLTEGFTGGTLACGDASTADACTFDTSRCTGGGTCGDNIAGPGEQCDGTDLNGESCGSQGYAGGTLRCMDDCSGFDTSFCTNNLCGNGQLNAGEDCDGTNLGQETCESQAMGTGSLSCKTDCHFDFTRCNSQTCGNNQLEGSELCDGTNLAGQTCFGLGYDSGTLGCNATCTYDFSACLGSVCGDGWVSGDEECEGTNLNGTTCASWGFYDGILSCGMGTTSPCRMDFSLCANNPLWTGPTLVSSGQAHTCATTTSNMVYCWGSDQYGMLGIQSGQAYQPVPKPVSYSGTWLQVSHISAGGMHTCAVSAMSGTAGNVLCWGNNTFGQLGLGSGYGTSVNLPTQVNSLTNIIAISAGFNHTCAIKEINAATHELYCWGDNSANQLGIGNYAGPTNVPVLVGLDPRAVACGERHTCAINTSDNVYCWGSNDQGQSGNGSGATGSNIPLTVSFSAATITTGANHTCATATGPMGDTYCWGKNDHGQLGLGHVNQMNTPTMVTALLSTTQLSAGGDHTCMIGQRSPENDCGDAFDNDGDGFVDCDDSDCFNMANCVGNENTGMGCSDGLDNDGDGKTDCNDPDCFTAASCTNSEDCSDNTDNDGDGLVDCADPICYNSPMCMIIPIRVNCWGGNWYGQVGNATTVDLYWPTTVSGQY